MPIRKFTYGYDAEFAGLMTPIGKLCMLGSQERVVAGITLEFNSRLQSVSAGRQAGTGPFRPPGR
jgi:hypothetical protein